MQKPWNGDSEFRTYHAPLEQVEPADKVGFDYLWEVEHHFLSEYSHSSAPEVFLAAASQRTKNIRIGQGVALLPYPFNHPIRVAERAAAPPWGPPRPPPPQPLPRPPPRRCGWPAPSRTASASPGSTGWAPSPSASSPPACWGGAPTFPARKSLKPNPR